MYRIFCVLLVLSISVTAQIKTNVFIEGGKGVNCTLGNDYDDLALAIQKGAKVPEKGMFWLVMAKDTKGKVIAQTANVKGKTKDLERSAIHAAENYKFQSDFDMLMLRVISEGKNAAVKAKAVKPVKIKKRKI
jgi:hypothetical protein